MRLASISPHLITWCDDNYLGAPQVEEGLYFRAVSEILYLELQQRNNALIAGLAVTIFNRYLVIAIGPLTNHRASLISWATASHFLASQLVEHSKISDRCYLLHPDVAEVAAEICASLGGKLYLPSSQYLLKNLSALHSTHTHFIETGGVEVGEGQAICSLVSLVLNSHRLPVQLLAAGVDKCIRETCASDFMSFLRDTLERAYTRVKDDEGITFLPTDYSSYTQASDMTPVMASEFFKRKAFVSSLRERLKKLLREWRQHDEVPYEMEDWVPGSPRTREELLKGRIVVDEAPTEDKLGAGAYGCVYRNTQGLAVKRHFQGERNNLSAAIREIAVMRTLSHPALQGLKSFTFSLPGLIVSTMMDCAVCSLQDMIYPPGKRSRDYRNKQWDIVWVDTIPDDYQVIAAENRNKFSKQLLQGLEQLHRFGVIHFDIKPSNLLMHLDEQGGHRLKIADFGLAYLFLGHESKTEPIHPRVGTLAYKDYLVAIAEEGDKSVFLIGCAFDIWSAGMTILEMERSCRPVGSVRNVEELLDRIEAVFGTIQERKTEWQDNVRSPNWRVILSLMMELDDDRRIGARELLSYVDE